MAFVLNTMYIIPSAGVLYWKWAHRNGFAVGLFSQHAAQHVVEQQVLSQAEGEVGAEVSRAESR